MNTLLTIDFNRTLFDPDTRTLIPGAIELLDSATRQGYTCTLLAKAAPSRADLITELGLAPYLAEIILTENKTLKQLRELEQRYDVRPEHCLMIGDRAQGEIELGYKAGWRTIWVRAGRFAIEAPLGFTPTHTVSQLAQVSPLI